MFSRELIALAAALSTASAATYQGFNYASGADYATEFALAKSLVGTSGDFTSARLYTMIEEGSTNTPTSAIPAAIANDVTLLLGLWASGGQADFDNELAALTSAITQYKTDFTSRVAGISVGSEDLYRISPTGVINKSGVGAEPDTIVDYITQVKNAIAGTALSGALVGHVDTWTAWVNGSNDAVISACDFIGMDAYPYFQNLQANSITNAYDLFFSAYDQTVAATGGKPVWVTETGWPVSGPAENDADASVANAKTYWDQVACKLLGTTNTYWYTLNDNGASPSFGVTTGGSTPVYDLTCGASSSSSSSSASSTASSVSSSAHSGSASTTATGSSASASSASVSSSSAVVQTSVPVSSSAIASGGGSPADTTSASADSSAASFQSASSSAFSSAVASASSAIASASSALSAATTETAASASASAAGSASVASASSAAASASSAIAVSSSVAISTLATETGSGSSTSTGSAAVPTYTGAASTVRSTGGFVAALVAVLAFL